MTQCTDCEPGYYCVTVTNVATSVTTLTKTICPAGVYCDGGEALAAGTADCPIGYYCPAGTGEPLLCPPGKYCATTGLGAPTNDCDAGSYCIGGAKIAAPVDGITGKACPVGHYCPAGSAYPTACVTGYYQPDTSKTAIGDCLVCADGYQCNEPGLETY